MGEDEAIIFGGVTLARLTGELTLTLTLTLTLARLTGIRAPTLTPSP